MHKLLSPDHPAVVLCWPAMIQLQRVGRVFAALLILLLMDWPQGLAQTRNNFPGRRIGGGTRGECAARPIIHLVPESSVYAPGEVPAIAWMEGPSPLPKPLQVSLRQLGRAAESSSDGKTVMGREFEAAPARVVILELPLSSLPLVWESSYRCSDGQAADEFGFLGVEAPPALSLLVADGARADATVRALLKSLKASCGASVSLDAITVPLGLQSAVTSQWPQSLPVQCF